MIGKYRLTLVLAVLSILGGQTLSYADDGAASGATAVQEPETASHDGEQSGDSGDETATQHAEPAGEVSEVPNDGETNASEGDSGPSRPADSDPA